MSSSKVYRVDLLQQECIRIKSMLEKYLTISTKFQSVNEEYKNVKQGLYKAVAETFKIKFLPKRQKERTD